MLAGALSSSLLVGWWSMRFIWPKFNMWVHPPGRAIAVKAGGKGELSDDLNAAAPSCLEIDQNALTISSVPEMYPMAVICLLSVQDSLCVARRFWLPCHNSKKLRMVAILRNVISSASMFISKTLSVFVISNTVWSHGIILILAGAISTTMTFSRRVSSVVLDYLQPMPPRARKKQASTPTPCGVIENMLHASLARLANLECVFFCWRHQTVLSVVQSVLVISIWSGW